MNSYEISAVVNREEVNFAPIEAEDVHAAARRVREMFAHKSLWTGNGPSEIEPFMASVTISGSNATVKMPVECATR